MYATKADLVARFGENVLSLALMFPADVPDPLETALQDACEEVDGYLAVRYPLPLPNVPNNLKRIVCEIARYKLYFEEAPEATEVRYRMAIDFLKGVRDGKNSLAILDSNDQISDDQPKGRPSTAPIGTSYTGGIFSDTTLDMMPSMK
jgi:phage gp36-like protein